MSISASQIRVLRTAFQTCRPRSSLFAHRSSNITSQKNHVRPHSNDTTAPFSPVTPSSVSQDEVSHFSRLASSWWDPHGPSRLLHLMNPLRHDFIDACLRTDPEYTTTTKSLYSYLDIGCGGGIFASSAARKPHTSSVTAIDPTPEVIAVAKAQQRSDPALAEPKLTYLNCAIEDLQSHRPQPVLDEQFDIISVFEVIEHITQPSQFLSIALQHLKPGGWLVGSTISRHPVSYLTTKLIAEAPLIGVVPRGTHDWDKYIKPGELKGWFEKQNREQTADDGGVGGPQYGPVKIEGVVYVPVLGWRFVKGSEEVGNYFFGVQKVKSHVQ